MAVTQTTSLPAQPAAGDGAELIPLGGDGRTAPHSEYFVGCEVAGDASGGLATNIINLDNRYSSVIGYVACYVEVAVAAEAMAVGIQATDHPAQNLLTVATNNFMTQQGGAPVRNGYYVWYPPPVVWAPGTGAQIFFQTQNVSATEIYGISALIYNYVADLRRLTPQNWTSLLLSGNSGGGFQQ